MKKFARIFCSILIIVIFIMTVSGCGNKENGDVNTPPTSSEVEITNMEGATKKSWEIDKSPFNVEWYVGLSSYSWVWDSKNVDVHKVHKENTGLNNITFHIPASDANEKLSAMIASSTVPDVITLPNLPGRGAEQITLLKSNELVYDLKELSEKYAPDFIKRIPPSILNWHGMDGKFYAYISLTKAPERITPEVKRRDSTNLMMVVRQDLMDSLGIKAEDFITQDGMVETLKKVQSAKLKQNEVDITAFLYSGNYASDAIAWIAQFFGLNYEDQDGNYVMPLRNPKYLEALKFLNRLYREGILQQENMMMKTSNIKPIVANGNVFMLFGETGTGSYGAEMKSLYLETEGKAKYIAIDPVRSNDGSTPWQKTATMKGYTHTFISKSTKIPERLIRLFDYFGTEEIMMMNEYGIEGVHYDMVDGRVKYRDEVIELKKKDALITNDKFGFPDIMYFIRDSDMKKYYPISMQPEEIMLDEFKDVYGKYLYIADPLSVVGIQAGDPLATTNAKITLYINNEIIKMIMAESEEKCVQMFSEAVKKVEGMGYDKLNEHFNAQFLEAKKKLGVDRIYPAD